VIYSVTLNNIDRAIKFCKKARLVDGDVLIRQQGTSNWIDAKSMICIFSLNLLEPLEVKINKKQDKDCEFLMEF